jgi:hypothetical protein
LVFVIVEGVLGAVPGYHADSGLVGLPAGNMALPGVAELAVSPHFSFAVLK